MLHLIPARWHRAVLPFGHRLRKSLLRLVKPEVHGVSLIGFDATGRLLLVRHSYGTAKWSMPAGGMRRGEDPEAAIRREMREELGVSLDRVELVLRKEELIHGTRHHVWLYTACIPVAPKPDNREVIAAEFFALDDLPDDLERRVRPRLELVRGSQQR